MTQIFFHHGIFYSSDATEFIRRFPAAAITHGFSRRRPVRSLQITPETGKSPTDFTDIHRFFLGRFHRSFLVTQISQMTQIFFIMGFFIHRMTRNLFGGFLLRRLLTDFRGCDLSGRCRYPLRLEKVPQISQIYTDFSLGFFHRMTRNLFGDFLLRRLLTDFRRCDLSGRCRYPLRLDKEICQIFHKKICGNL